MDAFSALQVVVGVVLGWAGVGKVFGRDTSARAGRSALPRLVGDRHAPGVYRTTGVVELLIGAALLTPPFWRVEGAAAAVLTAGFVVYLVDARYSAPESSCGCLGSAAVPVSHRSIVRGLVLAAASGAMAFAPDWATTARERPVLTVVVAVVGLAVVVGLSPELDRRWLLPLRRLRVRLTHPLAGTLQHVPLNSTEQRLLRSPAYRAVGSVVRSDVIEHWDEGDWRFVTYAGVHESRPVTVAFAVPLTDSDADDVRVAIVDEPAGATVYRSGPALAGA